jgi:hypothetical protein
MGQQHWELRDIGWDRLKTRATRGLALSEGGAIVEMGLQDSLQALRAAMQAAAPWAVYGFVKRATASDFHRRLAGMRASTRGARGGR